MVFHRDVHVDGPIIRFLFFAVIRVRKQVPRYLLLQLIVFLVVCILVPAVPRALRENPSLLLRDKMLLLVHLSC